MTPSIYINLEDDVSRIVERIKKERSSSLVLVCPKRCFLFSDPVNLRLLKKQTDLLKKEVYVLTMDERGQSYAREAGFGLKFLPKFQGQGKVADIVPHQTKAAQVSEPVFDKLANAWGLSKLSGKKKSPVPPQPEEEVEEDASTRPVAAERGHRQFPKNHSPQVSVTEAIFPKGLLQKKHHKSGQRMVMFLVGASLLLVLAVVFVVLPKATVAVYPRSEPVTRDLEVSISTNLKQPDSSRLALPAKFITETISAQDQFQSQGKREVGNKAAGTVRIYNFTQQPLNLKSATTILTIGGKSYLLKQDVNLLKPTTYKNAATKEVDPASLGPAVEVVAAEGGESYNVPAGTRMEITNQVFGSRPQLLYSKTESAITGGTSRYLSLVSQQDITNSQASLENMALKELKDRLARDNQVIPEKAYVLEQTEFFTDQPVDSQTPTFGANLKTTLKGLSFNKQELDNLVITRVKQTLPDNEVLTYDPESFLSYKLKTADLNNGLATLVLHFEGQAVFKVDLDNIKEQLVGKSQNQVNEILKSKSEIDKIEITLAPVWQKNFPFFAKKIDLDIVVPTGK